MVVAVLVMVYVWEENGLVVVVEVAVLEVVAVVWGGGCGCNDNIAGLQAKCIDSMDRATVVMGLI